MTRPVPAPRHGSRCGCGPQARGTCPHLTACPQCHAAPGAPCKRPSGHPAGAMHTERYRASERADAAACPSFEPIETPAGTGCRHCSGLPEDHGVRPPSPAVTVKPDSLPFDSLSEPGGGVQGWLF
jgi:hypothetical protein